MSFPPNPPTLLPHVISPQITQQGISSSCQILNDAFNLARSGRLSTEVALGLTSYLGREKDYIPWSAALRGLGFLDSMLVRTPAYGEFKVICNGFLSLLLLLLSLLKLLLLVLPLSPSLLLFLRLLLKLLSSQLLLLLLPLLLLLLFHSSSSSVLPPPALHARPDPSHVRPRRFLRPRGHPSPGHLPPRPRRRLGLQAGHGGVHGGGCRQLQEVDGAAPPGRRGGKPVSTRHWSGKTGCLKNIYMQKEIGEICVPINLKKNMGTDKWSR